MEQAEAAYEDQFEWPMSGSVTSIYWECRSSCARYHRGIDIANGCDTPIYAARAGTASVHSDPNGYGNYVKVNHGDGFETLYAHMASVSVSNGQSVTTNTRLGYEGTTGSSTGCHVHFEIRQDDAGPSVEVKQFMPGRIGESKTRGAAVPFDMKVLELDLTTTVRDGPNVDDVAGQGDEAIGTAQAGEHYVAYSSWTNDANEVWYAVSFNGRIGWLPATRVTEVGGTVQRVTADGALNVRSGAGTNNGVIGQVYGAQSYYRLASGTDGGGATWYQLHFDGTNSVGTGWVHGGYTTTVTYDDPNPPPPPPPTGGLAGKTITVDPGHGGSDPGAQGFGTDEADVNLAVALDLRDYLEADGATVLMTRTTDATVSLVDRVALANANGADRFVSVHANSCGGCGARGTETFYHDSLSSTSNAAKLAGKVQPQIIDEVGTTDRGVKQANFYVLRETSMPAILVETAFLDQANDHALLTDPTTQRAFARAILYGLQEHYGETPHDPIGDPDPDPDPEPTPGDFSDGFEGADPGWGTTNDGGPAAWAVTTARAASGSKSMAIRDYGANEDDALTTPGIDMTGATAATLTLESFMDGEESCSFFFGCTIYDSGTVQVSGDGGVTWRTLKSQYVSSGGAWETLSYDLDNELGASDVRVRFTFTSDGSAHNEGWYVDDVAVTVTTGGDPPPPPPPPPPGGSGFSDDFETTVAGWSQTNGGGSGAWGYATARAQSGSRSMALAPYGGNENDVLTSPRIDLTGLTTATLSVASWMEGERACSWFGFSCTTYDYGKIEVTADAGASWRTLTDQYYASNGWETLSYSLDQEAGNVIELRFTFVSDGSVNNEGWYLDDLDVS